MRILIVSHYWLPENGVPQRRWDWLSGLLASAGHEVLVLAPPPHYERETSIKVWWSQKRFRSRREIEKFAPSIEILRTGFFPAGQSITQKALNQVGVALSTLYLGLRNPPPLANFKPDLVVGTVPAIPSGFVARAIARKHHVPYMVDLRDAWPDVLDELENWNTAVGFPSWRERIVRIMPTNILRKVIRWSINSLLDDAVSILVTSKRLKNSLDERLMTNAADVVPAVSVVRNVFPPRSLIAPSSDVRERSLRELNVLYAGTVGRAQNLANAISAASIAKQMGINVRLKIVGSGAAKARLKDQARALNVDATFEPRRSAEDLSDLYRWADTALVHLAGWKSLELAIPSKTYELMFNQLHISAVVAGETADVVRQYNAGHVVPPDDPEALAQLWASLCHEPDLLEVGEKARKWVVEQFQHDAPAEFIDAIDKIFKAKK